MSHVQCWTLLNTNIKCLQIWEYHQLPYVWWARGCFDIVEHLRPIKFLSWVCNQIFLSTTTPHGNSIHCVRVSSTQSLAHVENDILKHRSWNKICSHTCPTVRSAYSPQSAALNNFNFSNYILPYTRVKFLVHTDCTKINWECFLNGIASSAHSVKLHSVPNSAEFVLNRSLSFGGNCLRNSFGVICCGFILVWLTGRLHLNWAGGHTICACSGNMRSFPITDFNFFLIHLCLSKYVFWSINTQFAIRDLWANKK